tara:strand:- start:606 stop:911 length:306 start_codon:yes stop_codon:yes gene_type:complete
MDSINIKPTWAGIVWELLRTLPYATGSGLGEHHKLILNAARVADKHVEFIDELALVEEVNRWQPDTLHALLTEKNGVAYRAVWVPVGGVICNTLTPIGGEK